MGEWADQWSAEQKPNIWGTVPTVIEMQSEGGAAGALHGALQAGSLATTFTASQGLLLMIPNMYKIAGELTPHGLSRRRPRPRRPGALHLRRPQRRDGRALHRLRHAVLELRAGSHGSGADRPGRHPGSARPLLHFFDGFRTSHEVTKIEQLTDDDMRAMIDEDLVRAHRARALSPDHPVLRGTAQNPDVYFQAREAVQPLLPGLPRPSCRTRWTSSRSSSAASTTSSTTSARPMPSASSS